MPTDHTYFAELAAQIPEIPPDSIVSRTVLNTPALKVILFGFAAGQELSEHTSARPAIMHFLRGEAAVTVGDSSYTAAAGTFVHMAPRVPHSVAAQTEVVMLLLMLATES
jgi:quercetin dioxygenase-like cupin family protein